MATLKEDYPKITFRPTVKLRKAFRYKCFMKEYSQNLVLIELINLWINSKVRIPGEKK